MKNHKARHGRRRNPKDPGFSTKAATADLEVTNCHAGNEADYLTKEHCRRVWRFQRRLHQIGAAWLCLLWAPCLLGATVRWSATSNKIYVEGGGAATLSSIKAALPGAPLDLVDAPNKIWLLRAGLQVRDGCTLTLQGAANGGDVNELRLQSVNSATPCNCLASITADWGTLIISSTRISSWDTMTGGPDTNASVNGRAFIRVLSSLSTNGVTPLESRMDITNSEICHLGMDDSDSYGLVWKVSGLDTNQGNSLVASVHVYGNIVGSHIHHNYAGVYTLGARGMAWVGNEVAHNVQYGFGPHNNSDNLLIQGNNVHHNGDHGILASVQCDHLIIRDNLCWSNAEAGILLYRSSNLGLVEGNQCFDNGDSGIALTASSQCIVRNNQLSRNAQAGVRLDLGSADNQILNNQCASNALYGFYFFKGGAVPEPNDDGRPKRNQLIGNLVHDNGAEGIRISDADDNVLATNTFNANGPKLRFQRGLRNRLDGNQIPAGVSVRTEGDAGSAASTSVRNQASLKIELGTNSTTIFEDSRGRIYEPDEPAIMTEVSTTGTSLTLDSAAAGSASTVIARNFWAGATPGVASLNQLVWSPASRTQWSVTAASVGQALDFTLGDLVPNGSYRVSKATVPLTTLNSDASGQLHFSDTATSTNPSLYAVEITNGSAVNFKYSAALNRIYVENGATATLSDIKSALPGAPLYLVDEPDKIWLLSADLLIRDGSTLALRGAAAGGDVNELRLLSLNSGATGSVVSVTADWGTLDLDGTKITSWDAAAGGPDTNPATFGRAFIRVRSTLSTNGITPQESRMDIRNSEIAYLGSDASEGYGLVWKVAGASPNPNTSIFDLVNVHGDVTNSRIHDNYIGAYTYGAAGTTWSTNEIYQNVQYGLDLQSSSEAVVIRDNSFHHNGSHGLIASGGCDHLRVEHNLSWSNARNGIQLDGASDDSLVEDNSCSDNGDSGIAIVGCSRNAILNNVLVRNVQSGLRLNLGSTDNRIDGNVSLFNLSYGFYCYIGGAPAAGEDGRPRRNVFASNLAQGNLSDGVRVADSDDTVFTNNVFLGNGDTLRFERASRSRVAGNDIPDGVVVKAIGSPSIATVVYFSNQARVRVQVDEYSSMLFEDSEGRIFDPDENGIATRVTTGGSALTLAATNIGTLSTVITRSLWVRAITGSAWIKPYSWPNGGTAPRQWLARPDAASQTLTYTLGDLGPNQAFTVRKAGVPLMTLNSSPEGRLSFSDLVGTNDFVLYSVEPKSVVYLVRDTTGFNLTWTEGNLQHATTLSPPNWQAVPTTNGQFSLRISPTQSTEFFRTVRNDGGP